MATDLEVAQRFESVDRKIERFFACVDDLRSSDQTQRELVIRLEARVAELIRILDNEEGFSRCVTREQRVRQLEKEMALLLGGGCAQYKELKVRIEALESDLEELHTELLDKLTTMEVSMNKNMAALEETLRPINKKYIQVGAVCAVIVSLLAIASPFLVAWLTKMPH